MDRGGLWGPGRVRNSGRRKASQAGPGPEAEVCVVSVEGWPLNWVGEVWVTEMGRTKRSCLPHGLGGVLEKFVSRQSHLLWPRILKLSIEYLCKAILKNIFFLSESITLLWGGPSIFLLKLHYGRSGMREA